MNPFQMSYLERLSSWRDLREEVKHKSIDQQCIIIDKWWQQAPLISHNLHWNDTKLWPDPWTLLSDNIYCTLTRAVGMIYTLFMNDVNDVQLVHASDSSCEEHYLVIVDNAKNTMNYWPNTVISISLDDFKVLSSKDLKFIRSKIK